MQIDRYIEGNKDEITEHDWVIQKLETKLMREQQMEKFESKWLHRFQEKFPVEKRDNESFMVTTRSHGIIDFYPKSNKILLRKKNQWKNRGLNWLVRNLLEMK